MHQRPIYTGTRKLADPMNYRIAITIARPSGEVTERNSTRLLEAFDRTHPEAGAAIGANRIERTLDVTFSLDADHVRDASERAWRLFGVAVQATMLPNARDRDGRAEFRRPLPPGLSRFGSDHAGLERVPVQLTTTADFGKERSPGAEMELAGGLREPEDGCDEFVMAAIEGVAEANREHRARWCRESEFGERVHAKGLLKKFRADHVVGDCESVVPT